MISKLTDLQKLLSLLTFSLLICFGCKTSNEKSTYSFNKKGYYWKLTAFSNEKNNYKHGSVAWVNAVFKTLSDSIFYDSEHDMNDRFYIRIDSTVKDNFLKHLISLSEEGDSLSLMIRPEVFFKQQFKSEVPYFCKKDTSVKVELRIKKVIDANEFNTITSEFRNNELAEIEAFFGSAMKFELSRDSLGFYWVEKPQEISGDKVKYGDQLQIKYEGAFLNGRVVDISPDNFQINYGTPDQLIKGLNYVIGRLKVGQNSKIIVPSQLAFGENGSSNGNIPPCTPMLYKISITAIKN